ncbi:MAG: hypothetical protein V3S89_15270 [Desulfobacterales bacterium]
MSAMKTNGNDLSLLRDLAKQYAEIAAKPVQEERRDLWRRHFSLKRTRPPVLITYGMHNVWCRDTFSADNMECEDPFLRWYERWLRMQIFHDAIGDDYICEPWIPQAAAYKTPWGLYGEAWGMGLKLQHTGDEGGAFKLEGTIAAWEDMVKLKPPAHEIDEDATASNCERLGEAIGDILEIDVSRSPVLINFAGDISTTVTGLRGLEQIMLDMYDSPVQLRELLSCLRDGVLENQGAAEAAGDFSLTSQSNQAMTYAEELEAPKPNSGARKRNALWGFCAAQEYALVSPAFHEEFLLKYQMPIMAPYGLVHYGCCEDLTQKIDMLRQIPNLRSIAVTPRADVRKCADQIGKDYVVSWRPNPTDMVCTNWDPDRVTRIIRGGAEACRDSIFHIYLKDVETVQGEPQRLQRWTQQVRAALEQA